MRSKTIQLVRQSFRFVALTLPVVANQLQAQDALMQRPNILYILSDDHRADFLGCAGHPVIKTPTIDRLAENGVRFSHSFVTTSICAASRASIFTGLYERTHKFTFGTPPLARSFTDDSYPTLLHQAGYRTGFVGKFGVTVEAGGKDEMFDFFVPLNRSPYFKKQEDGNLRHVSEITGDKAIEFLHGVGTDRPFCLSISFNAAHAEDGDKQNHFPWPKAMGGMYDGVRIQPPRLSDPQDFESQPEFLKQSLNRIRYFWRWDTAEKYAKNVRAYYRMISGLDHVIGRVLEALDALQLSENTVVIFSGDNGYYKGSRGFEGKWSHYEESLRVPLVIYDPRLPLEQRGRVLEKMALNIDIPATILDLAGLEPPKSYQGETLMNIVRGNYPKTWRTDFFCEHLFDNKQIPKWEGVRGQRYVYARYFQQDRPFEFLHDLVADPKQRINLVGDSNYARKLKQMRRRSIELRDTHGGEYSLEKIPTESYLNQKAKKPQDASSKPEQK